MYIEKAFNVGGEKITASAFYDSECETFAVTVYHAMLSNKLDYVAQGGGKYAEPRTKAAGGSINVSAHAEENRVTLAVYSASTAQEALSSAVGWIVDNWSVIQTKGFRILEYPTKF